MVCICAGIWPGNKIPLVPEILSLIELGKGHLQLSMSSPDDHWTMTVDQDTSIPTNEMEVWLTCPSSITWRKEISAWNFCLQRKISTIFTDAGNTGMTSMRIKKERCPPRSDTSTIILSKSMGVFANMTDRYHFDPNLFWDVLGGTRVIFDWDMDVEFNDPNVPNVPSWRITCINKDANGRIYAVGGDHYGKAWRLESYKVIDLIRQKMIALRFFVEQPTGDVVNVVVSRRGTTWFLKTEADGDEPNNLLRLGLCTT